MDEQYQSGAAHARPPIQPIIILGVQLDPVSNDSGGASWVRTGSPKIGALLFGPDDFIPTDGEYPASVWLVIERGAEDDSEHVVLAIQRQGASLEEAEAAMRDELRGLADLFVSLAAVRT